MSNQLSYTEIEERANILLAEYPYNECAALMKFRNHRISSFYRQFNYYQIIEILTWLSKNRQKCSLLFS